MDFVKEVNLSITTHNLSSLEILIDSKEDWGLFSHQQSPTFFMLAYYYNNLEAITLFKRKGYPLDLFEAAIDGDLDLVKSLVIEDPSSVNLYSSDGYPLLGLACFFDRKNVAELLIKMGADVNAQSRNPQLVCRLHSAAAANDIDLVNLLIHNQVDVNAKQQGGFTALHAAAQNGNVDMVIELIEHGADTTATTDDGQTALGIAKKEKRLEMITLLSAQGAHND